MNFALCCKKSSSRKWFIEAPAIDVGVLFIVFSQKCKQLRLYGIKQNELRGQITAEPANDLTLDSTIRWSSRQNFEKQSSYSSR